MTFQTGSRKKIVTLTPCLTVWHFGRQVWRIWVSKRRRGRWVIRNFVTMATMAKNRATNARSIRAKLIDALGGINADCWREMVIQTLDVGALTTAIIRTSMRARARRQL